MASGDAPRELSSPTSLPFTAVLPDGKTVGCGDASDDIIVPTWKGLITSTVPTQHPPELNCVFTGRVATRRQRVCYGNR